MVRSLIRIFLILVFFIHFGASCPGTETGNPGEPQAADDGGSETESYSNDDFGVSTEFENGWTVAENVPVSADEQPTADAPSDGDTGDSPETSGIDTSDAPSAEFTDGTSSVEVFFVTLDTKPTSLLAYLRETFPGRTFTTFVNPYLAGYIYDNPEGGDTGGDRQEYYFLEETTLLYVVTDLFEENDGFEKFETLINSIRFN